ncbi:MAG: hypothetical protein ACTHML_17945 [Ginsengibacter sp.]
MQNRRILELSILFLSIIFLFISRKSMAQKAEGIKYKPVIDGTSWLITGDPDLGKNTSGNQQPVDFGIWQAADSSWQVWSCIRGTNIGGKSRLFFSWQGGKITDTAWIPMGISMVADTGFGETKGGLQAPYVMKDGKEYLMFYGDWENICLAKGDGKTFARQIHQGTKSGMFTEGSDNNTRDPMAILVNNVYYCYYTAYPNGRGAVYVRTSVDLERSPSEIVAFGGSAGSGKYAAECPFVYFHKTSGYYYLFRTQHYGKNAQTSVYQSRDPKYFGANDDTNLVTILPVAAPEIFTYNGQIYMADLLPSLKGIRISKLKFEIK